MSLFMLIIQNAKARASARAIYTAKHHLPPLLTLGLSHRRYFSGSRQHFSIKRFRRIDHPLAGIILRRSCCQFVSYRLAARPIAEHCNNSTGKANRVIDRYEKFAVAKQFSCSCCLGRDDRRACRHCFQNSKTKAFSVRGGNKKIECTIERLCIVEPIEPKESLVHVKRLCEPLKIPPKSLVDRVVHADYNETGVRKLFDDLVCSQNEFPLAFQFDQFAKNAHDQSIKRDLVKQAKFFTQPGPIARRRHSHVDAMRNDGDLLRRKYTF